jgi:hypothetical protein
MPRQFCLSSVVFQIEKNQVSFVGEAVKIRAKPCLPGTHYRGTRRRPH